MRVLNAMADTLLWLTHLVDAAADGIQGLDCGSATAQQARNCSIPTHHHDAITEACAQRHIEGCDRLRIFVGDQSDVSFLQRVALEGAGLDLDFMQKNLGEPVDWERGGWDIIIDDGSHVPRHQLITFTSLFPCVRPGGVYVIEDIESSYYDGSDPSLYHTPIADAGLGMV